MTTEITSPENWLQRLGRLNRFAEHSATCTLTTVIPLSMAKNNKQSSQSASFLNKLHIYHSAHAWYEYLQKHLDGISTVSIERLYEIYRDFYEDASIRSRLTDELLKSLEKSRKLINDKVLDPIWVSSKKPKDGSVKIKRNSLRGDNRFVQMAVCKVNENREHEFPNEYAYTEDNGNEAQLTEAIERITGYGDSNMNLLSFMKKVHHNIKGTPKAYKDVQYLNDDRSPDTPVYLSYTPDDLQLVGGDLRREQAAIYYLRADQQAIGAMQLNQTK